MDKEITFHYSCNEMSLSRGVLDRDFFSQFPDVKETARSSDGRPVRKDIGDLGSYLVFAGTAILSSKVVAAAITAWLEGRKRKIVISIKGGDKEVQYEGPNLERDLEEIALMIDRLANESPESSLMVRATELSRVSKERDSA